MYIIHLPKSEVKAFLIVEVVRNQNLDLFPLCPVTKDFNHLRDYTEKLRKKFTFLRMRINKILGEVLTTSFLSEK